MEDNNLERLYYFKVTEIPGVGLMVAIADADVMGVHVVDEERNIQIIVDKGFYGDTLAGEDRVRSMMMNADVIVLAGDRVISMAIDMGLVNPDSILEVKGVKHVQVYKFKF
ncbi:MAG: DUF424 family protein [Desulfurococcales archaeon]|nr:DUF424 family protein [Desulfurococcales archaeon]